MLSVVFSGELKAVQRRKKPLNGPLRTKALFLVIILPEGSHGKEADYASRGAVSIEFSIDIMEELVTQVPLAVRRLPLIGTRIRHRHPLDDNRFPLRLWRNPVDHPGLSPDLRSHPLLKF